MPDHVKFMLKHAAFGAIAALVFVALLLWFNVVNLQHLVTHSPGGYLALVVMTVFFIITFSSVQMGIAIMGLGEENDDDDQGGGPGVMVHDPVAIPIPVSRRS